MGSIFDAIHMINPNVWMASVHLRVIFYSVPIRRDVKNVTGRKQYNITTMSNPVDTRDILDVYKTT